MWHVPSLIDEVNSNLCRKVSDLLPGDYAILQTEHHAYRDLQAIQAGNNINLLLPRLNKRVG
jgi:hypothetical protein